MANRHHDERDGRFRTTTSVKGFKVEPHPAVILPPPMPTVKRTEAIPRPPPLPKKKP